MPLKIHGAVSGTVRGCPALADGHDAARRRPGHHPGRARLHGRFHLVSASYSMRSLWGLALADTRAAVTTPVRSRTSSSCLTSWNGLVSSSPTAAIRLATSVRASLWVCCRLVLSSVSDDPTCPTRSLLSGVRVHPLTLIRRLGRQLHLELARPNQGHEHLLRLLLDRCAHPSHCEWGRCDGRQPR
jgi:hypothetical protein